MGISAAVVGGAVVGGVASNMAAGKQADAAENSAEMSAEAAEKMRQDLAPYNALGLQTISPLLEAMGYYQDQTGGPANGMLLANPNAPMQKKFSFDASNLENTPGYQFTMQQGLKGIQNQMANRGLGLSGAQLKGATGYAAGLANTTYGDQYNRALSTFNTNYNVSSNNVNNLQNLLNMGQNSAAQSGQAAITGANNAGNYLTQAGNAEASGIMGTGNAINSGINNYMMYNALYK